MEKPSADNDKTSPEIKKNKDLPIPDNITPLDKKIPKIVEPKPKSKLAPLLHGDISGKIQTAENLIASGNLIEARKILYDMLDAAEGESPAGDKLEELLGRANIEMFKSDIPCPEKKLYTIQKGDNLIKIADFFKTTVDAIQTANRMDAGSHVIFPGKTLSIYSGDWKIKVSKPKFKLYLMDGGKIFKVYKIGIGRQDRTPSGIFEISVRQKDPVWYSDGKVIPFGDSQNILGTRWMALSPIDATDKNLKGYGIHGTWDPASIGQSTSNGCVRMTNDNVNELYAIVPQKTIVTIE
jgi:LysM repeat protein